MKKTAMKTGVSVLGVAAALCALSAPTALSSLQARSAAENAPVVEAVYAAPKGLPQLHESLVHLITDVSPEVSNELHPEEKCLAQAVYFEARSEPLEGQLAVAQVVLNRVDDPRYPTTICGVVFQGEHRRNKCQFSFACDGLSDTPYNAGAWSVAAAVSHIALQDYWDDVTATATHYHADYVMPYWGEILEARVQHGKHIFYRDDSF
ncbi:MAG: cell wall hydrolase [Pseudomonadota bacterium]